MRNLLLSLLLFMVSPAYASCSLEMLNAVLAEFQLQYVDSYTSLPQNYGFKYPEFVGLGIGFRFGSPKGGKFYIYWMSPSNMKLDFK
jgi:hypothetical protein